MTHDDITAACYYNTKAAEDGPCQQIESDGLVRVIRHPEYGTIFRYEAGEWWLTTPAYVWPSPQEVKDAIDLGYDRDDAEEPDVRPSEVRMTFHAVKVVSRIRTQDQGSILYLHGIVDGQEYTIYSALPYPVMHHAYHLWKDVDSRQQRVGAYKSSLAPPSSDAPGFPFTPNAEA